MLRPLTIDVVGFRAVSGHAFRTATVIILLSLADAGFSQNVTVTETAGLRRFGYPVTALVEFRRGDVGAIDKVRLLSAENREVAAQFTAFSHWNDGSLRKCEIDFITGIGPQESQSFRVEPGVGPKESVPKGIEVSETDDAITVTSSSMRHQIRRDGRPLLRSITYGNGEFLAKDGVTTSVKASEAKIIKRGPFNATIEMGNVRLEYVSSKSWVKLTQRSEMADIVTVDGHLSLTSDPLLWDLGMGSWLYGTLHEPQDVVELRKESADWRVVTSKQGGQPMLFATSSQFDGCGHFADRQRVAAFGIADCSSLDDPQIQLSGDGRIRLSAKCRELTVYFHLVGQPIPVTAVTSPQSMVTPLRVTVEPAPSHHQSAREE